jgi:hypothetical protein
MTSVKNPKDVNAAIIFDDKGILKYVVPDHFHQDKNDPVKWVIEPPGNEATVSFGTNDTPLEWRKKSGKAKIVGKIRGDTKDGDEYAYTVTAGAVTIDPRIRIGKH